MFSGRVDFAPGSWHTWALKVDLLSNRFEEQKLTWLLDGNIFFEVTGAMVGASEPWAQVAHMAFFPILNVAVGGDYPGNPNGQTLDGYESGMQVKYVAVYKSNT